MTLIEPLIKHLPALAQESEIMWAFTFFYVCVCEIEKDREKKVKRHSVWLFDVETKFRILNSTPDTICTFLILIWNLYISMQISISSLLKITVKKIQLINGVEYKK